MRRAAIAQLGMAAALLASTASREQEQRSEPSPPDLPPAPPASAPTPPIDPWEEPEPIAGAWGNRAARRRQAKLERRKR